MLNSSARCTTISGPEWHAEAECQHRVHYNAAPVQISPSFLASRCGRHLSIASLTQVYINIALPRHCTSAKNWEEGARKYGYSIFSASLPRIVETGSPVLSRLLRPCELNSNNALVRQSTAYFIVTLLLQLLHHRIVVTAQDSTYIPHLTACSTTTPGCLPCSALTLAHHFLIYPGIHLR